MKIIIHVYNLDSNLVTMLTKLQVLMAVHGQAVH